VYKEFQIVDNTASAGGFWDVHWGAHKPDVQHLLSTMENRDVLARYFEKTLPRKGRVLEAGCGVGQYVAYLRSKGIPIEGLDFSESAIALAKLNFPDLPVRVGDLRRIDAPDGAFDAILCFGVIEHFENGPDEIMKELKRVLSANGRLYISVPYDSLSFRLTRWLERLRRGEDKFPEGVFYQYRFRRSEFIALVRRWGLKVQAVSFYGGIVGLKRRISFLKSFISSGNRGTRSSASSEGAALAGRNGHRKGLSRFYPLVWFIETQLPMFAHMVLVTATDSSADGK
jgi:SAM-dependent methyltransferase